MRCPLFLQIVSVSSAVLSFCLGLAAVSTFGWFVLCNGSLCLRGGLYAYSGKYGHISRLFQLYWRGWGIGHESSVAVAAAFVLVALVFLFVGTCFTSVNLATTLSGRYSAKTMRVAVVHFSVAVTLLLIAMILLSANGKLTRGPEPDASGDEPDTNEDIIEIPIDDIYHDLTRIFAATTTKTIVKDSKPNSLSLRHGSSYVLGWVSFGLSLGALVTALFAINKLKTAEDTGNGTKVAHQVTTV